jgi:hypothetical protein
MFAHGVEMISGGCKKRTIMMEAIAKKNNVTWFM